MKFKFLLPSFLCMIVLSGCAFGDAMPKLVAHRGESAVAPENTVPAFTLAWRNGRCWAVETDVQLTKDNVLVCCHNATTKCTTGRDWRIKDKTFAELRTLDAGSFKGPMWYGVKLPSLQEVFQTLPRNGHIFVEIKSAGPKFAKAYEEARLASGVTNDQVTIISFFRNELENVRKTLPHVRTLLLLGGKPSTAEILKKARSLGVIGVDLHKSLITKERVEELHKAGFEVHVWTVDNISEAEYLRSCGVDSITTNRSKELYEELKEK